MSSPSPCFHIVKGPCGQLSGHIKTASNWRFGGWPLEGKKKREKEKREVSFRVEERRAGGFRFSSFLQVRKEEREV